MSAKRDDAIKTGLDAMIAAANMDPKGLVYHAFVSLPVGVEPGTAVFIGTVRGQDMDFLLSARTTVRLPRGQYRMGIVMVPEESANVGAGLLVTPGGFKGNG